MFPFIGLQVGVILWLLLCPRRRVERVRRWYARRLRWARDGEEPESGEEDGAEEMNQDLLPRVPETVVCPLGSVVMP